jgi:hypothetical protein
MTKIGNTATKNLSNISAKNGINNRSNILELLISLLIIGFISTTLLLVFYPFFAVTIAVDSQVQYQSQVVQDSSIEVGVTKITQKGAPGIKTAIYHANSSILNVITKSYSGKSKEIKSIMKRETIPEITVAGTRKYQFMHCSNGTARYFTDEQFKNPKIGFTHKSPDYCLQNQQGQMTKLADSAPGSNTTINYKPSIPSQCTTVAIPYITTYQNVSYLNVGQSESTGGLDGYRVSCPGDSQGNGKYEYTIQPINKVVYSGTYLSEPTYVPPVSYPVIETDAKQKCTTDYNVARSRMGMSGGGDSSAMEYLEYLYAQCLAKAGT